MGPYRLRAALRGIESQPQNERPIAPFPLARRPNHHRPDPAQWRLRHERTRDRLLAGSPAARDGQVGQRRREMRTRIGCRARPIPVDRPDRHYPDQHRCRRLFGRKPRRAGSAADDASWTRTGNR